MQSIRGFEVPDSLLKFYQIECADERFLISQYLIEKLQKPACKGNYTLILAESIREPFYINNTLVKFFEDRNLERETFDDAAELYPRDVFTLKYKEPIAKIKIENDVKEYCTLQVVVGSLFNEIDAIGLVKWKVSRPKWMREEERNFTFEDKFGQELHQND